MKILVPVKRVADYEAKIRPKSDGTGVDLANVKMSINPFCEIAAEEAVRIKESGSDVEVIIVCIGTSKAQEQIRTCLALGADRGILVETDDDLEPLAVAKCLKNLYEKETPDLVILGKQSIDGDNNQTGQMLAALLGLGQGTFASKVALTDGGVDVTREVDGGLQTVNLNLPAIVTTDLRLNEPRRRKITDITKAKKKPLDIIPLADLGLEVGHRTEILGVEPPPSRTAGIKVGSVDELIEKLKNEAKVL